MDILRQTLSRFRAFFHKRPLDKELDAEVAAHLELAIEENLRCGLSPLEARRQALIRFGGVDLAREQHREARGLPALDGLLQDLRYALRQLRKNPGFACTAVFTLALGIGANTAIFSVVNAVLLQPLPYPHSDRLAIVWSVLGKEHRAPASGPELIYLQQRSRLFEEFAGIWVTSTALTGEGEPEQVKLGLVTYNFLSLLSPSPALGRFFLPEEQGGGRGPVVILSDGLWRRRFSADPQIVGRSLRFGGGPVTVVGVMPANFKIVFPEGGGVPADVQAYIPFSNDLASNPRDLGFIRVVGRLRQGVTVLQAQAEADSIATHLRSEFTEFSEQGLGIEVFPLHGDSVRNIRPALFALFGGVGLFLLIACANVANLLLSRASQRRQEITLRVALGASRSRIIRQLLTESILIASLGGLAAMVVGSWALNLLMALWPGPLSRLGAVEINRTVLLFTSALSLVTGIAFGLAPAVRAAKLDLVEALKEGGRNTVGGKSKAPGLLVVCEVALGFVLLIGAGLMLRTFVGLLRIDPGFDPSHVLTFQLTLPGLRYPTPEKAVTFFQQLEKNLASLPGVQAVGAASHLPLANDAANWYSYYWPEGTPKPEENTAMADYRGTLPGYFKSLGANLLVGRDFGEFDDALHAHVAIVDDTLARQTWPNASAIGRKLSVENIQKGNFQFQREWVEVVGVVRHIQNYSLTNKGRGQIYLPYPLAVRAHMAFTVRMSGAADTLVGPLRREVAKLDKDLPVAQIVPMEDYVQQARSETWFITVLAGVLAGIALLLACVGIYGVVVCSVVRRTIEFGVRMALGGRPGDILKLVLRQSMLPVISGSLIGLALSCALTPLLSKLLYGVRPFDPATLATVFLVLCGAGLFACYLPARRATQVDPMEALRHE
jgi:predicted permease